VTRRIDPPTTLSPRARQIVGAARVLLEDEGPDALTLRTLAARLGIRAPSLYNHFPDKATLETAMVAAGLFELALALETAIRDSGRPVAAVADAYRAYAGRHPHLYRLMTDGRAVATLLPADLTGRVDDTLARAVDGDRDRGLALHGYLHGMVTLGAGDPSDPAGARDRAWSVGLDALTAQVAAGKGT
jgi:AcrR family transcriptional regulator